MKPFVFKTQNNNHYLYSPRLKKFIVIPESSYLAYNNQNVEADPILSKFAGFGYLSEYSPNYGRKVTPSEIQYALVNIPQIVFEVTTHCNLKCRYCCFGENYNTFSERNQGILKLESAKILLEHISKLSFSNLNTCSDTPLVISFYGGEPLLNIALIKEIVEYAKSLKFHNRYLRFSLTTNATLLAKNIEFLKENDFAILVSLDGDYKNNAYRVFNDGKSSYHEVLNNLSSVKAKYPQYFETIRFNSVFTNISNVEELLSYFNFNFGKTPQISPLHISDGDNITEELKYMSNSIPNATKSLIENYPNSFLEFPIHKRLVQLLMYMTDSLFYNELSFMQSYKDTPVFPTHTCIPFTKRLFLSVDNKIMPCEKVSRHNPLARINNGCVEINYSYIAEHYNNSISPYSGICNKCALEFLCNHCSYSSSKMRVCPEFKSYEHLEEILGNLFSYIEDNPFIVKLTMDNIILK